MRWGWDKQDKLRTLPVGFLWGWADVAHRRVPAALRERQTQRRITLWMPGLKSFGFSEVTCCDEIVKC